MRRVGTMAVVCLMFGGMLTWGQGSPSASSSSGGSGPSIESQAITYQALSEIAGEIAKRSEKAIEQDQTATCKSNKILLLDSTSVAQINAYSSFTSQLKTITEQFEALANKQPPVVRLFAFPETTTAVASALTAIRGSQDHAEYTFTADQIALIAELLHQLKGYALVTAAIPSFNGGNRNEITGLIEKAYEARVKVGATEQKSKAFESLDKELSDLVGSLQASNNGVLFLSSVLGGQAILTSLNANVSQLQEITDKGCGQFHTLTLQIDAAGGGTRQNHIIWMDLIRPLAPSYNGGAVVTYMVATRDGKFLDGDVLRRVFNYSKWNTDKVEKPSNFGGGVE